MIILYFDCFYGITASGCLGALIDLGIKHEYISEQLSKVNFIDLSKNAQEEIECSLAIEIVSSSKLNDNTKFIVNKIIEKMSVLVNEARNIPEFLRSGKLSARDMENVVSIGVCIDFLKPEKIVCSKIEVGFGSKRSGELIYPIPNPIIMDGLKNIPIKTDFSNVEPTDLIGAAIVLSLSHEFTEKKEFIVKRIGRTSSQLGIYTAYLAYQDIVNGIPAGNIDNETGCVYDRQYILECNIDDMNPEIYDFVITKLFKAGAADVYFTPIIMKKGRPAIKISVLCSISKIREIEEILFSEVTTFGIRKYEVDKTMLQRSFEKVNTKYGEMTIKRGFYKGKCIKAKPEYDECRKISNEFDISISEVYKEWLKSF